jgi:DNA-directed RNA polymerase specialized sigma24 family protein
MGLTVAAVKSRMHRGRALLRRALAEEEAAS